MLTTAVDNFKCVNKQSSRHWTVVLAQPADLVPTAAMFQVVGTILLVGDETRCHEPCLPLQLTYFEFTTEELETLNTGDATSSISFTASSDHLELTQ